MDQKIREEIAQFRYSLIGPIVSRTNLSHGEKSEMLRKISNGEYEIPYSNRRKVGLRTLERYLNLYEKGRLKALEPGFRHRSQRIPEQYMEEAVNLRRENRRRSIETIISMLEQSGRVPEGVLKRSTVYDHFVSSESQGNRHLSKKHTVNLAQPTGEKSYKEMYTIQCTCRTQ
jgi:hypothetical protein